MEKNTKNSGFDIFGNLGAVLSILFWIVLGIIIFNMVTDNRYNRETDPKIKVDCRDAMTAKYSPYCNGESDTTEPSMYDYQPY